MHKNYNKALKNKQTDDILYGYDFVCLSLTSNFLALF
jgi:hypothetical protein